MDVGSRRHGITKMRLYLGGGVGDTRECPIWGSRWQSGMKYSPGWSYPNRIGSRNLFIATSTKGERNVLIIGLEQENIRELLNDRPIRKNFSTDIPAGSGLEDWDIMILGPEDLVRFVAHFGLKPEN